MGPSRGNVTYHHGTSAYTEARDDSSGIEGTQCVAWAQCDSSTDKEDGDENPDTRPAAKEVRCGVCKDGTKEGTSLEKRNDIGRNEARLLIAQLVKTIIFLE